MARTDSIETLATLEGTGAISIVALHNGWPSLIRVQGTTGNYSIAAHASTVSPFSRREHEFRFQNPGDRSPVSADGDAYPILLGHFSDSNGPDVFVGVDGTSRLGRDRRFSILFNREILENARHFGWATYVSSTGEKIVAFLARFASAFFETAANSGGDDFDFSTTANEIEQAVSVIPTDAASPQIQVPTYVLQIVRRRGFSSRVLRADQRRCLFCGINGPLLQAAHIYPYSAPGSVDDLSNGLTLCANHHLLFDSHHLAIAPQSNQILRSPEISQIAEENTPLRAFLESTVKLLQPGVRPQQSLDEMLTRRLHHFEDYYRWLQ